jgi:hypothetical protein
MQQEQGYREKQYYVEVKTERKRDKKQMQEEKPNKGLYKLVKEYWTKIGYGAWILFWFSIMYTKDSTYGDLWGYAFWWIVGIVIAALWGFSKIWCDEKYDKYERVETYVTFIGTTFMYVATLSVPFFLMLMTIWVNNH